MGQMICSENKRKIKNNLRKNKNNNCKCCIWKTTRCKIFEGIDLAM